MAAENPDVRWKQRFHSFRKAHGQLRRAVKITEDRELSELERQGLIKAFEFTDELSWKTLKGYLEDGETWMEMVQSRNRSAHTYNEKIAGEVVAAISEHYAAAFAQFEKRFRKLEKESP